MNEKIFENIIDSLKNATLGLTIVEISKLTAHNRNTVSKYLEVLEARGDVISKKIGVYKLWLLKTLYEKQLNNTQTALDKIFFEGLTEYFKISTENAIDLGEILAQKIISQNTFEKTNIKTMAKLLEMITRQMSIFDNLRVEIANKKLTSAIIRIYRDPPFDSSLLDWYFEMESAIWQNIFKILGHTSISVSISDLTMEYCDILVKYSKK